MISKKSYSKTELFNKYILPEKGFIYRLCLKYSRSEEECREYNSEILYRLFNSIETYNPQQHIRPWLYTIIRRFIGKTRLEQSRLQKSSFINIENSPILSLKEESNSCNCISIDNYQCYYSDDILEALSMLSPISQKAILLQQTGYKLNEIAENLYNSNLIKKPSIESAKYYLRIGKQ